MCYFSKFHDILDFCQYFLKGSINSIYSIVSNTVLVYKTISILANIRDGFAIVPQSKENISKIKITVFIKEN